MDCKDVFLNSFKHIFIISNICFIFFCNVVNAQNLEKEDLVGVWQFGSSEISSGWYDNYLFFNNGSFVFNTNQNEGLKRIISIGGTFILKSDTLFLYINYSKELTGGIPTRSNTVGSSGWAIQNGTVMTIKHKPVKEYLIIQKGDNPTNQSYLLLNSIKYFKADDDPNNY